MSNLIIKTFGAFQVSMAGKKIADFRTRKVEALLVYLGTEQEAHSRNRLLDLFWPGLPERSARSNLRQILYYLKQSIPDGFGDEDLTDISLTIANRQEIQLNPEAGIEVDNGRFEALLDEAREHDHIDLYICPDCRQNLEEAVALYQGDFLTDFFLDDSNVFEEWAQSRREYFRRRALDGLSILTTMATRRREYGLAESLAERQLEIDNLSEGAYRQLMEVLALNGRREQALGIYENCRRILVEELGMAPTARTTELYEKILAGDLDFDKVQEHGVRGYDLKELIAEGGHGAVHRAIQPVIGREVAVKVIRRQYADDPDFIRRFEAEAQIVARLEHPHIVPLYDYWRDPNGAYLVMRYMRQGSLLGALESGPWKPPETAALLTQIAAALSTAHQKGVIHRDIKPGNILLDENGNAYLTDFGIAKDLLSQEQITSDNAVVGTLDYTSPEQILSGEVTPQSDIYSLGAVIYETLTGEKPFADDSIANLLHNHLNNPMPLVSATRPDVPVEVDTVLQKATAKKAAERYATTQEMAEAFFAAVGGDVTVRMPESVELLPEVAEIYNPYKGLRAFQEADADDFFGRDTLVQQLVDRLGESSSRFLAIVGPSGSGKSSAVKAGLIPALRAGALPGSENWFTAEMVPGTHPLEELELALWPIAVDPPPSLVEPMERDTRGLLRILRRILPGEDGSQPQLLLIIDQFEELFTLVEDKDQRAFFLDSLLAAIQAPRSPLSVVVTLRADFYDRPLLHQEWGQIIKDNTEIVLPLNHSELTWAIREPARRMGVRLQEDLVTAIVSDVADQLGALPLLQYALTELFERREGNLLTGKTYEAIGGVQGALGRRAEGLFEHLDNQGKEAARQLFLRLVTLGEGIEDTRRRVLRSEVTGLAGNGQAMEGVLDEFGQARLLTFDRDPVNRRPTVEVAHEALLREWLRLRRWLEQSRDDVRLQRLLAQAAAEWVSNEKDEAYLLRGNRLDQFAGWSEETQLALTRDEKQFMAASLAARAAREEQEEARRQRELEAARQLAESEKVRADDQAQAAGRLRQRAVLLGGALVVAAVLALAAFFFAQQSNENAVTAQNNAYSAATSEAQAIAEANQRATAQAFAEEESQRADQERAIAQENEAAALAAEAEAVAAQEEALAQTEIAQFNEGQAHSLALIASAKEAFIAGNVDLALALAVQAVSVKQPPTEAVRTLTEVTFTHGTQHIYEYEGNSPRVDIDKDIPVGSPLIAAYTRLGSITVWDSNDSEMLNQFNAANEDAAIVGWATMPNSTQFVVGYNNGEMIVWDWSTGEQLQKFPGLDMTKPGALFPGPDQDIVVSHNRYGGIETEVDGVPAGFEMAAYDIESGDQIYRIDGAPGESTTWYDTTPDNKIALIGASLLDEQFNFSGASRLLIIDLETGEILSEPALDQLNGNNYIKYLKINPAGNQAFAILTDVDNSSVTQTGVFISLPAGEVVATVPFDTNVRGGTYSPDGSQIAVIIEGAIRYFTLLDTITGESIRHLGSPIEGHTNGLFVGNFVFTPDGKRLVSGDSGGNLLVWDVETGELIQRLFGHGGENILDVVVSPDGNTAISSGGGSLRFWDITQGTALQVFEEHEGEYIFKVVVSPDGTKAISTNLWSPDESKNEAILWDTSTFEVIHRLPGFFYTAKFLADGRSAILGGNAAGFNQNNPEMLLVHWDIESGEVLNRRESTDLPEVFEIAISPDDSWLLWGTRGHMYQYDIATLSEMKSFSASGDFEWLLSVVLSPDGQSALAGGDLGDIILFDLDTGEEIRRYNQGGVTSGLDITANGQRFVSAGNNNILVLWDVATGEAIQTFNGHTSDVTDVTFTLDESQLVSVSGDGRLILWDVATGEILRTYSEHSTWVSEVALSPDGQLAYSSAEDGTVIVRPIGVLSVDEVLAYIAENRVLRDFACVERRQYRILPLCDANVELRESGD